MFAPIEGLLVLQDRDRRILDLKSQLEKIPLDRDRAESRLDQDKSAVASAHEESQRNGVAIKNFELDIETRRNTVGRLKTQQFETRKNEEYQALGHEIERYEAEIDRLETGLLELMETADRLKAAEKEAAARLDRSREVVREELENLETRRQATERELEAAEREREALADGIDSNFRELYDRLRVKKGGLAVVPIEDKQCGGCHVRLIPSTIVKAQAANQVVQCENCGRILYLA